MTIETVEVYYYYRRNKNVSWKQGSFQYVTTFIIDEMDKPQQF